MKKYCEKKRILIYVEKKFTMDTDLKRSQVYVFKLKL